MDQATKVIRFIETFLTLGGSFEGTPFKLLPFQKDLIRDLYRTDEGGNRLRRQYLLGLPRKNGKSQLGAALALYHLVADASDPRPLVISAAADRAQARLVFDEAARMVRASSDLSQVLQIFRQEIRNPANGGLYKVVSSDAGRQHGMNPSFVVFDELHVFKNADLLEALTTGSAMRRNPLFLIISTAGYDLDSPLGRLYQYGLRVDGHALNGTPRKGEVQDPSFGMTWWGPEPGAEVDPNDRSLWHAYNPAGSIMPDMEGMLQAVRGTLTEAAFTRFHLNGWTSTEEVWIRPEAWAACANTGRTLKPGEPVVLGFDGAWKGDSTALVAVALEDLHTEVIQAWEAPPNDPTWRTPVVDVEATIREAFRHFKVVEMAADPYRWEQTIQTLQAEGLPVVEFPTNAVARMVPACQTFYELVQDGGLSHGDDPLLNRHLANARVREDARGARITKEHPGSKRHIDAAVAAVVGVSRAVYHRSQREETPRTPRFFVL